MRLREGARIAVIGTGPSGLMAAKHALEAELSGPGAQPQARERFSALLAASDAAGEVPAVRLQR